MMNFILMYNKVFFFFTTTTKFNTTYVTFSLSIYVFYLDYRIQDLISFLTNCKLSNQLIVSSHTHSLTHFILWRPHFKVIWSRQSWEGYHLKIIQKIVYVREKIVRDWELPVHIHNFFFAIRLLHRTISSIIKRSLISGWIFALRSKVPNKVER